MNSLVAPENILVLWILLFGITAFSLWAEKKKYGKFLGGVVIAILAGFVLGNFKIMPNESPLYDTVDSYLLPLAIPLLLFSANLNKIAKEAGPTLAAFLLGTVGTVVGAVLAFYIVGLPDYNAEFTGTFASTYIGGGMNFAAVSHAMGIPEGDQLTAAYAADNIASILFLFFLGALPAIGFISKRYPGERGTVPEEVLKKEEAETSRLADYTSIALAIFMAVILVAIGNMAQDHVARGGLEWKGFGLLVTTLLALLYATYAPELTGKLKGSFDMGMVLMMLFFASLGARADIVDTLGTAPMMFAFVLVVISVHVVILFTAGKFLKFTLPELITASNACILGPATAAGLAGTKGWKTLVTPGILVGILGYAIGNFIGIGLANLLG